jgi:putative transposase
MYPIDPPAVCPQSFSTPVQLAALQEFLSDDEIETICRHLGHTWRRRVMPPGVTVRSMVYRSLHPDRSIQAAVADLAAGLPEAAPTAAAWCQARSRLPADLWPDLLQRSVDRLRRLAGSRHLVFGRPLYVVDGSTLSMPDEPDLVDTFGYANTRHGFSRFPVARFAVMLLAGVEAVCAYRLDPYRTGEDWQLHQMWGQMPDGCICLLDRHFASFYNLAKLPQRDIDVLTRLHQRRRPDRLIAQGRRLGPQEWIVTLDLSPQLRRRYDDPSLPSALRVRLIRVAFRRGRHRRRLWLVTTLLDRRTYPRRALIDLYRRRWGIETRLGSLKTT